MIGLLASLLAATTLAGTSLVPATNAPPAGAAPTNGLAPKAVVDTNAPAFDVSVQAPVDPVEIAYRELLARDDAAQEEIDQWIREADAQGENADARALQKRISDRIVPVDKAYREFLEKNPDHARARIAFGSFLNDTGREDHATEQWEKARKLDPTNPAIYNNLAGIYGHRGPITNAFACWEKAIELDPKEPVYYHNFGTSVLLFRRDVMEYYHLDDEQKVFDKAIALYRKALELGPRDFIAASDLAQTYYLVRPPRTDDALAAWQVAYELAADDLERQGVRVHFARLLVQAGRFAAAKTNLDLITNTNYFPTKERIIRTLEAKSAATNQVPTFPAP